MEHIKNILGQIYMVIEREDGFYDIRVLSGQTVKSGLPTFEEALKLRNSLMSDLRDTNEDEFRASAQAFALHYGRDSKPINKTGCAVCGDNEFSVTAASYGVASFNKDGVLEVEVVEDEILKLTCDNCHTKISIPKEWVKI